MKKDWQVYKQAPLDFLNSYENVRPLLLQLLYNRKIEKKEDLVWFLELEKLSFLSPFLFKDMKAAVDLIIFHIKKGNQIMIYGDYDADGVTSSALLYDVFQIFKAKVDFYLPDRVSEGYGLNKKAIEGIKKRGFSLIITVDNGIRNKEEVRYAQEIGLDVIITDHHAYPEKEEDWPSSLIINSAHQSSAYPFRFLAGVGVAFKLAVALIESSKLDKDKKNFLIERTLDLAAIGTITDMVPLIGENRLIVARGLKTLNKTRRLGLIELIKSSCLEKEVSASNIAFQLGPRLNAASRMEHANSALNLLISKNSSEAEKLAQELCQKNTERQKTTEEVLASAESQIDSSNLPSIIIINDFSEEAWNEGVIGLVAGKISEKYYRPVLIIIKTEEEFIYENGQKEYIYKGSARSIEGFDMVKALEASKDYLYKYGGHPMAGGFSLIGKEQTEKFISKMKDLAQKKLEKRDLIPKIKIDSELSFSEIDEELLKDINRLSPFGQNNPKPFFVTYNVKIIDIFKMGSEGQHIKFKLLNHSDKEMRSFWALSFGGTKKYGRLNISDNVDLVYSLEFNNFNGQQEIQLKIIDIR